MNYGDHNIIEITQQIKLRVALVVSSESYSHTSISTCRARRASRARRVERVEPCCWTSSTAKMHGLDTSNVSSRESRRDEPSGIWAICLCLYFNFVHIAFYFCFCLVEFLFLSMDLMV